MTYTIDPIPLWTPNPATVGQTRMAQLIAAKGKANYAELWQWSVDEPEAFWSGKKARKSSSTAAGCRAPGGFPTRS